MLIQTNIKPINDTIFTELISLAESSEIFSVKEGIQVVQDLTRQLAENPGLHSSLVAGIFDYYENKVNNIFEKHESK